MLGERSHKLLSVVLPCNHAVTVTVVILLNLLLHHKLRSVNLKKILRTVPGLIVDI